MMPTAEVTADGVIDCIAYVQGWRRRQLGQAPWCVQSKPFSTGPSLSADRGGCSRPGVQLGAGVPQALVSHNVVPLHPMPGPQHQIQSVVVGAHQVVSHAASRQGGT
jgi:hypothetical protein